MVIMDRKLVASKEHYEVDYIPKSMRSAPRGAWGVLDQARLEPGEGRPAR